MPARRSLRSRSGSKSIYALVRAHVRADGTVDHGALDLPDDADVNPRGRVRWAAGAMDGVGSHHVGPAGADERVGELADLLAAASGDPSTRRLRKLAAAIATDDVIDYIDLLIESLAGREVSREGVRTVGRWLATNATGRGATKAGIALMGVGGLVGDDDEEIVVTLGRHEEFTLYSVVALCNGLDDPEPRIWELGRATHGWGRIQCVERLEHTTNPEIREWILRHGFRNDILDEYLAYIGAATGDLAGALDGPIDRELLDAAAGILVALITGGPARDIDDLDGAADLIERYLVVIRERGETLADFRAVHGILSFLRRDGDWDASSGQGWTATRRAAMEQACEDFLAPAVWDDRIRVDLMSSDSAEFWSANAAARVRGLDTFELLVARIEADPFEASWYDAWRQADRPRAERLVQLARDLLPLDRVATGPSDALGLGEEYLAHGTLDWTLQELRHFVGVGGDLLLIGLRSPVVRNRNMALSALKEWSRQEWPDGARQLVEAAASTDPNDDCREHATEVLAATE